MTTEQSTTLSHYLSSERMAEVDAWVAKYPAEEPQSAVMRALMLAQEEHGHLTQPVIAAIADYLKMPEIAVYEVATFYSMYKLHPAGKHTIGVCCSFACKLRGSDEFLACLSKKLDVAVGETTADKCFTLRKVECLGACNGGPVAQIDKDYHENLTPENIDAILDKYRD